MKRNVDTKFYTMDQNNSGGYFEIDQNDGICEIVVIESINTKDASNKAVDLTECYSDYCVCCGERWDVDFYDDDGTDVPMLYGKEITDDYSGTMFRSRVAIHFLDGTIKRLGKWENNE